MFGIKVLSYHQYPFLLCAFCDVYDDGVFEKNPCLSFADDWLHSGEEGELQRRLVCDLWKENKHFKTTTSKIARNYTLKYLGIRSIGLRKFYFLIECENKDEGKKKIETCRTSVI